MRRARPRSPRRSRERGRARAARGRHARALLVPMPDGCRLAARIWLPRDAEPRPVPAILEYIPYRKRDFTAAARRADPPLVRRRTATPRPRRHPRHRRFRRRAAPTSTCRRSRTTASRSIAWIARSPGAPARSACSASPGAASTRCRSRALRPPALKAIVTRLLDRRPLRRRRALHGRLPAQRHAVVGAPILHASSAAPPDPAIVGERWRDDVARAARRRSSRSSTTWLAAPAARRLLEARLGLRGLRRDRLRRLRRRRLGRRLLATRSSAAAGGPARRRARAWSARGATSTRTTACPGPRSASCRRRCAGGTTG